MSEDHGSHKAANTQTTMTAKKTSLTVTNSNIDA